MPFISLLGWGVQDGSSKAGATARLLAASLAASLLVLVALLASRGATFYPDLDIPVFLRVSMTSAAAHTPEGPVSLVLGASHHKTGTVQLFCLGKVIEAVAGGRLTAQVGGVTAADVAAAAAASSSPATTAAAASSSPATTAAAAAAAAGGGGRVADAPAMLLTALPLAQECYGRSPAGDTFRCGVQEAPCTPDGSPSLSLDGCFVHLPLLSRLGIWHYVRRPLDVVVSAFWYHMQQPAPEEWIKREFSTRIGIMQNRGVPLSELAALGLKAEQRGMAYGNLLRSLPEEEGILLEFWRSAPGLYAMARQYGALQRHPGALQLRYEEAQRDYNATLLSVGARFFPQHARNVLEAGQVCNPATWSRSQLSGSNHVTAGKHSEAERERLQRVLMGRPQIARHLCQLTEAMGYDEPRCGMVSRRRLRH